MIKMSIKLTLEAISIIGWEFYKYYIRAKLNIIFIVYIYRTYKFVWIYYEMNNKWSNWQHI